MRIHYKFAFLPEEDKPDFIRIDQTVSYDMALGHGFAESAGPSKNEDLRDSWPGDYFIPSVKTFLVDVPYGNYRVSVTLGGADALSSTTVKAGLGSIMLDNIQTPTGQFVHETFAIHVENGQLKLAFSGEAPSVRSIVIERDPTIPTLFLAGDSTVTDQPSGQYPYAGWGQMIGKFFTSSIAVSNHARSGRSSKSFIDENRLDKIWNRLRPSDYLLVQFAHNDEKDNAGGTKPFSTYEQYLREYIHGARRRGVYPILVSPMHRRFFDEQGNIQNTHGDYIEAMRQLAVEENVLYIDLAGTSKRFFEQLGEEGTKNIFMWAEANEYPGMPEGARDNTHFSEQGGIKIARLVAECIREAGIEPLKFYLR
ncbi:rhamnogalacturonan acetylesterase [Paenibacillus alginolyticus]|uniref:Rhamnogalacturonan acetylesterase n=1 Tax=Paenibacillus alginolyticus TaxID=59839 RepID=A0ABT4G8H4_9BACL|nr:rhamnogalacturonan acetylesterase [Paenibacillus alginolyticus]MCY9668106.1 rhamnogalacturonan acetylesterase [Paenibacillus alginolyticus]MCY9692471.1 rhamnogalacturonan acetylesterase [Paenibacillus alginolyticus]MEC0144263.1 rhamnogalacturonan acetylesterase [Paenibacillus alginolyticus]